MHIIQYNRWASINMEDPDLKAELNEIKDDAEAIRDRFAIDLSFGTAGMRGVIGVGTNRMNIYTVRKASQGLANMLINSGAKNPSVAIGYDSRIKSDLFAQECAGVLAAAGVNVWIYPQLEPVPALSFAVRQLGCSAGVMVTASHNPAKYNGYKVYGPDGCQMTSESAGAVMNEISRLDIFDDIECMPFKTALEKGLVRYISPDVLELFYKSVLTQSVYPGVIAQSGIRLVYSPLNGAGNIPVRTVLARAGLTEIYVVPEQEHPDGNFPTAPYPNPEVHEALDLGLKLAQRAGADLLLATDPDADRVGIAVRTTTGEYHLLSGNEVGVLLLDYICSGRMQAGTMPKKPVLVKSIVSTPMADAVASRYGVETNNMLTGFKYIGERIAQLEKKGEAKRFIFGFEESYGYLAGTHVRDKDAVVASLLICEMAAWYKTRGTNLYDAMQALYQSYGCYLNEVDSFEFEGLSGMTKMDDIMINLRENAPAAIGGAKVVSIADYQQRTVLDVESGKTTPLTLPAANVLAYTLEGGSLITVRPSGTEPKIKLYFAVKAASFEEARAQRTAFTETMKPMLT